MSTPAGTFSPSARVVEKPAWWVSAVAALPWPVLYALAGLVGWLAWRVFPYRQHVVRENLSRAFPDLNEAALSDLMRRYYSGFAQVAVEIAKSARLTPEEMRRRVCINGLDGLRELLSGGTPALLVAAHQCNWEWLLLALSVQTGFPLDAVYKPLVDPWADREMLKLRSRLGGRLIPADELLADIIKQGRRPRAIALVADQEPRTSERMHWTRFLNRDSAFFVGPEEIARATRFPAFFVGMRRTARGHYEIDIEPLAAPDETLAPGEFTERYVRLVERQIHAAPADWPWSHKRWKMKRPLYATRGGRG